MRFISFVILAGIFAANPAISAEITAFSGAEGIKRLERSEAKVDFFPLSNHFEAQDNKIYCGLASSAIVLNALRLNNKEIAKPLDETVLSKEDRKYLPKDMNPVFERYTQNNLLNSNTKSKEEILGKPIDINGKNVADYGLQLKQLAKLLESNGLDVTTRIVDASLDDKTILNEIISNLKTQNDFVLVNYTRKALGQQGGGHISPLGAYDEESDSFLILDVNPNASGWAWVKSSDLIAAMRTFDTVENRGYLLVKEKNKN